MGSSKSCLKDEFVLHVEYYKGIWLKTVVVFQALVVGLKKRSAEHFFRGQTSQYILLRILKYQLEIN